MVALAQCFHFLLIGILLNVSAQMLFKHGMRQIGEFHFSLENIGPIGLKMLMTPALYGGILCYFLSTVLGLLVLSRVDVGVSYPLTSIGYILVAFLGAFFFGEALTYQRIAGIIVIIIGVYLVSRS